MSLWGIELKYTLVGMMLALAIWFFVRAWQTEEGPDK